MTVVAVVVVGLKNPLSTLIAKTYAQDVVARHRGGSVSVLFHVMSVQYDYNVTAFQVEIFEPNTGTLGQTTLQPLE